MTFHKSALFTFFLLMCYGLGLLLIYTHQNEEKWIPKVSFNLPTFMYTNHLNSQTQKATQSEDNPLPQPNLSLTPQKSLVLFSKKPLKQQTLVQPLTLETNAASLYKKDYAVQPNQAKIVLIISNLGVDEEVLNKAMATLPENVTLSFSTYSPNLEEKIKAARQEGFETMLNIAIETKDFPKHDPGNNAFYTFASDEENINILNHLYTQKIPFIGFLSPRPSHFETTSFFQKLIQNENLSDIKTKILATLSAFEQKVLSLYLKGYSYKDISTRLNVTSKSIDNALSRIRKKLAFLNNYFL